MYYTIKNDILTAEINSKGAELMSVKKDNVEYIWQGDPAYWTGRAYNLFPICGRMWEGKYSYKGNIYELGIHGFVRHSECEVYSHSESKIVFSLKSNAETLKIYPFNFEYFAEFELVGNKLITRYTATNTGSENMFCTFGGHPGFNVPLDFGNFNDYYLEFSKECNPCEIDFATGKETPFEIRDNKFIDLEHSLFDNDSIFLTNAADSVTLKSTKSNREVTVNYPGFKYIGIWHKPLSDAPYVCIEPWCGSPALAGSYADLETKADMFEIKPKQSKSVSFDIIFK